MYVRNDGCGTRVSLNWDGNLCFDRPAAPRELDAPGQTWECCCVAISDFTHALAGGKARSHRAQAPGQGSAVLKFQRSSLEIEVR